MIRNVDSGHVKLCSLTYNLKTARTEIVLGS